MRGIGGGIARVVLLSAVVGAVAGCGSGSADGEAKGADAGAPRPDATAHDANGRATIRTAHTSDDAGHGRPDVGRDAAEPPMSIFVVPKDLTTLSGLTFFDHPWPSDYRRDSSGNIILTGVYNPFGEAIIDTYVQAVTGTVNGFSTAAYGYLRFATDLDPSTLPSSPTDTLSATSTVRVPCSMSRAWTPNFAI